MSPLEKDPFPWRSFLVACLLSAVTLCKLFLNAYSNLSREDLALTSVAILLALYTWALVLTAYRTNLRLLQETQTKLIHSSRLASLGEMAGNLSHEINNPLAIIRGLAQRIVRLLNAENKEQAPLTQAAEQILETSQRITDIMQALRVFESADPGGFTKSEDLRTIAERVLSLSTEKLKSQGIEIRLEAPTTPVLVTCRAVDISQALVNLIGNACQAVLPLKDRWILITIQSLEGMAELAVTDSGQGVPSVIQNKLMEPFFTTKPPGRGTGLGLSIALGIIRSHSGNLFLDTNSKNTRFVIQLPRTNLEAL